MKRLFLSLLTMSLDLNSTVEKRELFLRLIASQKYTSFRGLYQLPRRQGEGYSGYVTALVESHGLCDDE